MTELRVTTTGPGPLRLELVVRAAQRAAPTVEPLLRGAAKVQAGRTAGLIHSRSGALAGAVKGTVTRKPYGYILRVGPGKGAMTVRAGGSQRQESSYDLFYGHFVEEGTGLSGPRGRVIPKGSRGLVPVGSGRRAPSGRGQRPQRPFSRARRDYDTQVARALDEQIQRVMDTQIQRATEQAIG